MTEPPPREWRIRPQKAAWAKRTALLAGVLGLAAAAQGQVGYLYENQRNYALPTNYEIHFPIPIVLRRDLPLPEIHGIMGAGFYGRYWPNFGAPADWLYPLGFQVFNGPSFPDPNTYVAPSGAVVVEFVDPTDYYCDETVPANLGTPLPPTYQQAKAASDAYCARTCGAGFVMTDFYYAQWRYACWYDVPVNKAYEFATWGGGRCQKPLGNGTYQECAALPLTMPMGPCQGADPACDNWDHDQNGIIDMADLAWWQINPTAGYGIGETYGVMVDPHEQADYTVTHLASLATNPWNEDATTIVEITRWDTGSAVNCDQPGADVGYLNGYNDPMNPSNLFYAYTDEYCRLRGASVCEDGGVFYVIDSCRRSAAGTDTVRLGFGNCMACL